MNIHIWTFTTMNFSETPIWNEGRPIINLQGRRMLKGVKHYNKNAIL